MTLLQCWGNSERHCCQFYQNAQTFHAGQIEPKKSKKAVAEEELDTVNPDETVEEDTVEQVEENTEEVA